MASSKVALQKLVVKAWFQKFSEVNVNSTFDRCASSARGSECQQRRFYNWSRRLPAYALPGLSCARFFLLSQNMPLNLA